MLKVVFFMVLLFPVGIAFVHFRHPSNRFTPWLLPIFLTDKYVYKSVMRRAGIGWIFFSCWLFGIVSMLYSLGFENKSKFSLFGGVFFVGFVLSVILFAAGLLHFLVGEFSKSDPTKPILRSARDEAGDDE